MTHLVASRFFNFWKRIDLLFYVFARKHKKEMDKVLGVLNNFTSKLILKRREYLMQKTVNEQKTPIEDNDIGIKKKKTFLDILLQKTDNGVHFSDSDIEDEVKTIMAAVSN